MILQKKTNIPSHKNNRLSVQVSLNGLSFLASNSSTKENGYYLEKRFEHPRTPEEVLLEIEEALAQEKALQDTFIEVTVIYTTTVYSLVPTALFNETKASDYLKFNSKILANDFIAHDTIENHDIVVVYTPYININNYLFERYGAFKYYHAASVLLKSILDTEKHSVAPKAFIHVLDSTFELILLKNGKLNLCNSYIYKTPEDFIYYILFCFEQLKLNPDTIEVVLCGLIKENDPYYNILYTYVRNIIFSEKNKLKVSTSENEIFYQNFLLNNSF